MSCFACRFGRVTFDRHFMHLSGSAFAPHPRLWRIAAMTSSSSSSSSSSGVIVHSARPASGRSGPSMPHRENRTEKFRRLREQFDILQQNLSEHKQKFEHRIMTVPNMLCFFRFGITPFIGALVVWQYYTIALSFCMVAAATDLIDGWIARRFPAQSSLLGSVLDPVADKFLVSVLFITLTYSHLIPLPLTVIVLLRDICLVVGGFIKRFQTLAPPITFKRFFDPAVSSMQVKPTLISKANTVLQMALVTLSLAAPVFDFSGHWALTALCWITAGTTIASGLGYMRVNAIHRVDQMRKKSS